MDEKLKYKTEQIKQILGTLEISINVYLKELKNADLTNQEEHDRCDMFRDSVTQRFEYSIEHFWKYLYIYLTLALGVKMDEMAPLPIIRTSALSSIISEKEAADLIAFIKERNKTSHIYKEEIADEVAKCAPKALDLMTAIVMRLDARIRKQQN